MIICFTAIDPDAVGRLRGSQTPPHLPGEPQNTEPDHQKESHEAKAQVSRPHEWQATDERHHTADSDHVPQETQLS